MKLKNIFKTKKEKQKEYVTKSLVLTLVYMVLGYLLPTITSFTYMSFSSVDETIKTKSLLLLMGSILLLIISGLIICILTNKLFKKRFYYNAFMGIMPLIIIGTIMFLIVDVFDLLPDYLCRLSLFTAIGVYSFAIFGVACLFNKIIKKK